MYNYLQTTKLNQLYLKVQKGTEHRCLEQNCLQ